MRISLSTLLLSLLLTGCISVNRPPEQHTTVVAPPGSTTTVVCPNGAAPPC